MIVERDVRGPLLVQLLPVYVSVRGQPLPYHVEPASVGHVLRVRPVPALSLGLLHRSRHHDYSH